MAGHNGPSEWRRAKAVAALACAVRLDKPIARVTWRDDMFVPLWVQLGRASPVDDDWIDYESLRKEGPPILDRRYGYRVELEPVQEERDVRGKPLR